MQDLMLFTFCIKNLVKRLHMKKGVGGSDSHMVKTKDSIRKGCVSAAPSIIDVRP